MTSIQLKPIREQVAVLIGVSSGIGRVTALKFAEKGAKLVLASKSIPGLNSLLDEVTSMGAEAIAVPMDVADFNQVQALADKAIEVFGRIDTWINLAATAVIGRFETITPEEFRRVIEVNLMGQVYGAMAALPYLKRNGQGALIHITSVEARRSLPLQSSYSCSKHGVEGFLDSLRVELMHDKVPVVVTNIMPATINTPFYNKAKSKLGVKPTGIPPYYEPDLVADAIVFAAENPRRDIIVGDAGRVLDIAQKISPPLLDLALSLIAVDGQYTKEPKSEEDANNLYDPAPEYDRIEGDYGKFSIPSFSDWLDLINPIAKWGAIAGTVALALLATQIFKDNNPI